MTTTRVFEGYKSRFFVTRKKQQWHVARISKEGGTSYSFVITRKLLAHYIVGWRRPGQITGLSIMDLLVYGC